MLMELLLARGGDRPFVQSDSKAWTYAEAIKDAQSLASGLAARGIRRFACSFDDPYTTVVLLCASAAVGAEACVYPRWPDAAELDEFVRSFRHTVFVTDRDVELTSAECIGVDDLRGYDAAVPDAPESSPVLILTTGTTGRPKGARHDWRRLVGATSGRARSADSRWLLAYNLNQFGGLQVVLHALADGGTLVVPASNQPSDCIEAMRRLHVTHASGTPTFWRFVVGLLDGSNTDDIALRQITLGGEAATDPLLAALRTSFPGARISHVYAATEFGSAVSVRDGRAGLPLSVLDRGHHPTVEFRIVDGELHVRSTVGMNGYYDAPDVDDGWRPTGDLVEVRDDRIHFVGRSSDIINVGGVKIHPLPVEEVVSGVEGVAMAAVYGRPNAMTGHVVAVDVVPADAINDLEELEDRIRDACKPLPPAARPRRVRFVDSLDLRENKLRRNTGTRT
jgi:acyl-coenzyme A synthetase/AMP-(fatty) acid ligase